MEIVLFFKSRAKLYLPYARRFSFQSTGICPNGMKLIEVDEGAHLGTSGISLHLFDASSNHKKRAWELPSFVEMTLVKSNRKAACRKLSIEHLLRPTDSFVGSFETTTPKDTTISSELNLSNLLPMTPIHANIAARQWWIEKMYVDYKFQKK
jgi:hypothetical protein